MLGQVEAEIRQPVTILEGRGADPDELDRERPLSRGRGDGERERTGSPQAGWRRAQIFEWTDAGDASALILLASGNGKGAAE